MQTSSRCARSAEARRCAWLEDAAKPISKSAWKPYNEYAAAPISAPVPAYTRYKFEIFNVGNTSGVADATFTAPHIAAVPLAASYKRPEFSAGTLAYIQPGPAKATLPVASTRPVPTASRAWRAAVPRATGQAHW